jgi:hypothetical protein
MWPRVTRRAGPSTSMHIRITPPACCRRVSHSRSQVHHSRPQSRLRARPGSRRYHLLRRCSCCLLVLSLIVPLAHAGGRKSKIAGRGAGRTLRRDTAHDREASDGRPCPRCRRWRRKRCGCWAAAVCLLLRLQRLGLPLLAAAPPLLSRALALSCSPPSLGQRAEWSPQPDAPADRRHTDEQSAGIHRPPRSESTCTDQQAQAGRETA